LAGANAEIDSLGRAQTVLGLSEVSSTAVKIKKKSIVRTELVALL
jgi:hypothetical protein